MLTRLAIITAVYYVCHPLKLYATVNLVSIYVLVLGYHRCLVMHISNGASMLERLVS